MNVGVDEAKKAGEEEEEGRGRRRRGRRRRGGKRRGRGTIRSGKDEDGAGGEEGVEEKEWRQR